MMIREWPIKKRAARQPKEERGNDKLPIISVQHMQFPPYIRQCREHRVD